MCLSLVASSLPAHWQELLCWGSCRIPKQCKNLAACMWHAIWQRWCLLVPVIQISSQRHKALRCRFWQPNLLAVHLERQNCFHSDMLVPQNADNNKQSMWCRSSQRMPDICILTAFIETRFWLRGVYPLLSDNRRWKQKHNIWVETNHVWESACIMARILNDNCLKCVHL